MLDRWRKAKCNGGRMEYLDAFPGIEFQLLVFVSMPLLTLHALKKRLDTGDYEDLVSKTRTDLRIARNQLALLMFLGAIAFAFSWWDQSMALVEKREAEAMAKNHSSYLTHYGYKSCMQKFDVSICDAIFQEIEVRKNTY